MSGVTSPLLVMHNAYRVAKRRKTMLIWSLGLLCTCMALLDLITGPAGVSLSDVLETLTFQSDSATTGIIVWELRMPVAVMALLVGGSLALAGAEMQSILGNPLAEPFTLGVSASAALGAALAIILGVGIPGVAPHWVVAVNAFFFALGSLLLLQMLSKARGGGTDTLVLFGIALNLSAGALLSLIQFSASSETLQELVFWTMGTLSRADWQVLGVIGMVILVVVPFSLKASWGLTALRLGEDRARSFGVQVERLRFFALVRISLLAATAVAFVGIIGFVGLVGPHVARMLVGEDHRFFLPASLLAGAACLSVASVLSKLLIPGVLLPIGIVTSLIGLPIFIFLIMRTGRGTR